MIWIHLLCIHPRWLCNTPCCWLCSHMHSGQCRTCDVLGLKQLWSAWNRQHYRHFQPNGSRSWTRYIRCKMRKWRSYHKSKRMIKYRCLGKAGKINYLHSSPILLSSWSNRIYIHRIASTTGSLAANLAAGCSHTCAALVDGRAMCWGWNLIGQLGNGNNSNMLTPAEVVFSEGSGSNRISVRWSWIRKKRRGGGGAELWTQDVWISYLIWDTGNLTLIIWDHAFTYLTNKTKKGKFETVDQ